MGETWRKVRIPVTGIAGTGVGATVSELTSETIARATGQKGWARVGVKGAVKGGLFLLFYGLAGRLPGLWSLFSEIAGYTSLGMIVPDVLYQVFPGGIWGLAESFAVSLRTWAVGAERIKAEIESLESMVEEGETAEEAVVTV